MPPCIGLPATISFMRAIPRRLMQLLVFNLAIGFMFHFSIVFPYMNALGFSTSQQIMYAIVTNIAILLVEVPAGILADRWSRKGVLLLSLVCMTLGCVLFGLADNFGPFMIATALSAIYFGMSSGVQAAILYDMLLKTNERKDYEKILGRLNSIRTVGYVISSIAGAALASVFSFQLAFYLSAISCVVGFIILLFFKEPQLHRKVESTKLIQHIADLFKLLAHHPETRMLALTSMFIGVIICFMSDVDPLWPLALGLATILYGPLNALILSSQGLAGLLAGVASLRLWMIRLLGLGVLLAALGLTIANIYVIVLSQFMLLTCATTLMVILSGRIQDSLPSSQRAGSESAISTISRLSFVALLPLFMFITQGRSVFVAAWMIVAVALLALYGLFKSFPKNNFNTSTRYSQ
jgi:MFS family permease